MTEYDPVLYEVERLQRGMKTLSIRVTDLLKLRSHPVVVPVQHYHQYLREHAEPYDWFSHDDDHLLRSAYNDLADKWDAGHCAAEGVSVGGCMLTMDELETMFGRPGW